MGISTIPDPSFVYCKNCADNRSVPIFEPRKGRRSVPHCTLSRPYRRLRGQKGCNNGTEKGAE